MTRRQRWMAGALAGIAVLAIAAGAVWWAREGIARRLIARQIEASTGRRATIGDADLDIWRGRLALAAVRLDDVTPGPPLAELDRLEVRLDLGALLRGHVRIREASVGGLRVRIVRSKKGALNIADLLGGEAGGSRAVTVDRLSMSDGAVTIEDRTRDPVRTWRADGIAIEVSGVSTQASGGEGTARLTATVDGAPVTAEIGALRLAPLQLRGRLAVRDLDATLAGIAVPAGVAAVLERARLSAEVTAAIDPRAGTRIDATGRLDDLALRNRQSGDPLVAVPSLAFTVDGAGIDAGGGPPRVDRLEVTGKATVFDARGSSSGRLDVERLHLLVEGAGGPAPSPARLALSAGLAGGGALDVQGPLELASLGAVLRVRATQLNAAVPASYAALPVGLAGLVGADLTVDLATASGFTARVRGGVTLDRAAVAGGSQQVTIARRVEVEGIDAQWPRIAIARIRVVQPVAVVERDRTGRLLVSALLAVSNPPAGATAAARDTGASPPGLAVEVGEIAATDGTVTVDDAAAAPPARLTFPGVRASVRNVAWPARGPIPITIHATAPGSGTIEAAGTMSLDPVRLDVRARLAGAALAPYQGYLPFPARIAGQANADLAVAALLAPRVDITAKGTASVSELAFADGDRRVMRSARIETTGLQFTWPSTLTVDRLHVRGSQVRVVRRSDGTFPLAALFTPVRQPAGETRGPAPAGETRAPGQTGTPGATAAAPPSGRGGSPAAISVTVKDALLEDSRARIIDESVSPPARVDLSGVRLAAQGFTWPARDPLPIDLRMNTPNGGRLETRGTLDLARGGADVKLALTGIDLSAARAHLPVSGRVAARASADLDVAVRLAPVSVTARGAAALADVALADGGGPIVTAARVEATGLDYAWPARVAIDRLRIQAPRAAIERRSDGTFPLAALLIGGQRTSGAPPARPEPPEPAGPSPAPPAPAGPASASPSPLEISIREGVLDDGTAVVSDAAVSPTARFEVSAMRLVARDVTWPSRGPTAVELRATMPGGGTVSAAGQLDQGMTGADLDVTLAGVDVAAARAYLPLRGRLTGKASARLALRASFEPLAAGARGTASLADLAVVDGERRLLTAEHAEVTGLDFSWPATVSVDRLRVRRPWALIDRVSGRLAVLDALATGPPGGSATTGAPAGVSAAPGTGGTAPGAPQIPAARAAPAGTAAPGLQLSIRRVAIDDGSAAIVDGAVRPPASLDIASARLRVRDLAWPARGPTGIELRAATPGSGTIEVRGQLRLDASTIDAQVALDRVDVAAAQSLVPVRARLGGKASADLRIKGTLAPLALTATGQVSVADASLGDGQRALATARGLDLTGLTAEWPRRRATIQRVALREPWALVERDASGALPLLDLVSLAPGAGAAARTGAARRAGPTPQKAAASPAAIGSATGGEPAPRVDVGTLTIEEGFVRFTDRTTSPAFVEEASRLTVTARALGTEPSTRSEVSVAARLTGGAQVELRGRMGPIGGPLFADARGQLSGLSLSRMNPYVNGLLGWVARRGSVSATTQFHIVNDRIEAANEIVIGQPRFVPSRRGDEVRERVGVPLDLVVSLLENTRREVRLSVPVTGTLSTREFDFGDAVWEAIRKAVINALALPVSWIGKIFYTADARIDSIAIWPVYFDPGTTRLRKGFDAHAERLGEFMLRTPAVAYAMKPVMTVADVTALKREATRRRIEALARTGGQGDVAGTAARLFAERFRDRPVPAELDAMLDELARDEPAPDEALRALAASRLALTRSQLEARGVDGTRLRTQEGAVPVEASGVGRVEFEMIPEAGETDS